MTIEDMLMVDDMRRDLKISPEIIYRLRDLKLQIDNVLSATDAEDFKNAYRAATYQITCLYTHTLYSLDGQEKRNDRR